MEFKAFVVNIPAIHAGKCEVIGNIYEKRQ